MDRLEERNHSREVAVKGCSIELASQPLITRRSEVQILPPPPFDPVKTV